MNVRLTDIRKSFGATAALDGVDLDVAAGEVHALIGENGAGKTTLMNILAGAFPADSGTMEIGGAPYAPGAPGDARRRGIAHIHQELALCPHLSVAENIFLGIEPSRGGWLRSEEMQQRAARLLGEFGRGEIDPAKRTGDLPLADRQVVEICRALALDARILLMDEPTSSLQRADIERLFATIRQLRDRGIAIIYISHFLEEVREIATRFTVLRDGRSVMSGALEGVQDEQLIAAMVGREEGTADRGPQTADSPIQSAVGGPRAAVQSTESVVLSVRDLVAAPRVHSASFDLHRGEVLGIAGLIGSGRSEMVRAIFGLTASTGEIVCRGSVGYLSEDRKGEGLALQLSIADNVTMSRFSTCARAGWIDLTKQDEQASSVMRRLRVKAAGPRATVIRLSGGNQQKVAFGRLLHHDPDVLLLDEPARGIDVGAKADIFREILDLARAGKGIVLVSSYLPDLFAVCDRIAVMCRGRLGAARPARDWTSESILQEAIGGATAA